MMKVLLILLLFSLFGGLTRIARINELTKEAETAFRQQDFQKAVSAYRYLTDTLQVEDDQIRLNLAHACFEAGETAYALKWYKELSNHPLHSIRTISHLQLGILNSRTRSYEQALAHFRQALLADPENRLASYNYELLKKFLQEQQQQQPEQPLQNEQQQDQQKEDEQEEQQGRQPDGQGEQQDETQQPEDQPSEQPGQQPQQDRNGRQQEKTGSGDNQQGSRRESESGSREEEQKQGRKGGSEKGISQEEDAAGQQPKGRSRSSEAMTEEDRRLQTQRLQQMNISQEKAQMLLDAMRSKEQQYLQQLPKKATKKPDRSKPQW